MPGPFSGGTIGGAIGGAIGGPIGAGVGQQAGNWLGGLIGGLFGGHATPLHQRVQHRFDEHPLAVWDAAYLAPKFGELRTCGLGPCDDNNIDRFFADNIVGYFNDVVIITANNAATVEAFQSAIAEFEASIIHHGPGHPDRSNPKKTLLLNTIVDYMHHLIAVSNEAISQISGGGTPNLGGGTTTGGSPSQPPSTPGGPGLAIPKGVGLIVIIGMAVGLLFLGKRG